MEGLCRPGELHGGDGDDCPSISQSSDDLPPEGGEIVPSAQDADMLEHYVSMAT